MYLLVLMLLISAIFILDINTWESEENISMQNACAKCNKMYVHKKSLVRHIKFECGKKPTFSCGLCSYKGIHNSCLRSHLKLKHNINTM